MKIYPQSGCPNMAPCVSLMIDHIFLQMLHIVMPAKAGIQFSSTDVGKGATAQPEGLGINAHHPSCAIARFMWNLQFQGVVT